MIPPNSIPLVLCGPMVRRVEAAQASVWVALRESALVELAVYGPAGELVALGTRPTVRVAQRLHVAVVSAAPGRPFTAGQTYGYGLRFQTATGWQALGDDGVLGFGGSAGTAGLRFADRALPSFVIPPRTLHDVRLVHGSCRKPHGKGQDAFGLLATLLEDAITRRKPRPQQLFLTGNQIYCDDVPAAMLGEILPLADWLAGGSNPERQAVAATFGAEKLAVDCRAGLVAQQGGYTSSKAANHLVTFLEVCAMYLLAWSDVLWPAALKQALPAYAGQLPAVRRTLANIATYMMFDDHDVTDDWNRTGQWCQRVADSAYGARLVQNALSAYALFQHWGNVPERFASGPEAQFLTAVNAEDDQRGALVTALPWGYRWVGEAHLVVALDTRTQRHYPTPTAKPGLMTDAALASAFAGLPQDARPTIVLSACPVLGVGVLEFVQEHLAALGERGGDRFDAEAWQFHRPAFDALIEQLAQRRRAIVLSGDVHYGFAATFVCRQPPHAGSRIVNFTSSALLNSAFEQTVAFLLTKVGNAALESVGDRGAGEPAEGNISRTRDVQVGGVPFEEEILFSEDSADGENSTRESVAGSRRRAAVLGNANFGEIRFGDGEVSQTLWYWQEDKVSPRWLEHRASCPA